ncbi:Iodotyrosine dehalogenase 1 [Strongyloides ratti]|uniref:Iodotyrosine dehalogenase 1 n=1 Tax=Strongyloides ratti TaxID=34506 RepID=A0A090KXG5_STRRB|nr:Iodotyrosine dehalogenase 1 [Strongyloides ratti]CEF60572.1 Iodotyrosine dehalogenase 1 [Strongyloides ratti]
MITKQNKKCLKKSKHKTESLKSSIFSSYLYYQPDFFKEKNLPSKIVTDEGIGKNFKKSIVGAMAFLLNNTTIFENNFLSIPKISHNFKYKAEMFSKQIRNSIEGFIEKTNYNYVFINYICFIVAFIYTFHQIKVILSSQNNISKSNKKINVITTKHDETKNLEKFYADKSVGDDFAVIDEYDNFVGGNDIPYKPFSFSEMDMQKRSQLFYETMKLRRSIRCFSSKSIPFKVIQNIIKTAGTCPSGSNNQPWLFCIVGNEQLKIKIRKIVENEEQNSYTRRMGAKWVLNVNDLTINWNKPYLTEAPYLIVVMRQVYTVNKNGEKCVVDFSELSSSIAVGFFITALHNAGLCTVPICVTNSSRRIKKILNRPPNEEVLLVLPIGYPADQALVPDIKRKRLEDITRIY